LINFISALVVVADKNPDTFHVRMFRLIR